MSTVKVSKSVTIRTKRTKSSNTLLAWAAGLFVGEGHVSVESRRGKYLILSLSMCDERAVRKFAKAIAPYVPERTRWKKLGQGVSISFSKWTNKDWTPFSRIHLGGRTAEGAIRALWPYLEGTDKGDQALLAFERALLPHPSEPMPEVDRSYAEKKLSKEQVDEIRNLCNNGMTVRLVAERFGVTEGAVRYHKRRAGENNL